MSQIKILQACVSGLFVLIVLTGVVVAFGFPEKMPVYGQLIGIIWPIFLTGVIPALIGQPLSDYVAAHAQAVRSGTTGKST